MACKPCQFVYNFFEWADLTLNTLLLGSPRETVSRRIARCRRAGERWAYWACKILTVLALFSRHGDHCTWALQPGSPAKEIWHWSPEGWNTDTRPEE